MSVSKEQQEVIDIAITSFIQTNDVIGRQYLKVRQDALEVTQQVAQETTQNGKASPELLLRLKELELEASQISQTYESYVDRIKDTLKYSKTHQPQYLANLESQFTVLKKDRDDHNKQIKALREESKPVVEKMGKLTQNFENGLSAKPGVNRQRGTNQYLTSKTSAPNSDSLLIDYASTVFDKQDLVSMFTDVDKKLRELRAVDDIKDDTHSEAKPTADAALSIDIEKHLDELLQNNRAFFRMNDARYSYDITRSSAASLGSSSMSLDDYNLTIESVIKDIQGLVEGGALAKERWMSNARKLEMVQTVLQSIEDAEMELDG